MTDNEVKRGQDGNSRKMIVVAAGSALLIFLAFIIFARTPKARLNIIQIVSLVVFTVLILRHGRTEGAFVGSYGLRLYSAPSSMLRLFPHISSVTITILYSGSVRRLLMSWRMSSSMDFWEFPLGRRASSLSS